MPLMMSPTGASEACRGATPLEPVNGEHAHDKTSNVMVRTTGLVRGEGLVPLACTCTTTVSWQPSSMDIDNDNLGEDAENQ